MKSFEVILDLWLLTKNKAEVPQINEVWLPGRFGCKNFMGIFVFLGHNLCLFSMSCSLFLPLSVFLKCQSPISD